VFHWVRLARSLAALFRLRFIRVSQFAPRKA